MGIPINSHNLKGVNEKIRLGVGGLFVDGEEKNRLTIIGPDGVTRIPISGGEPEQEFDYVNRRYLEKYVRTYGSLSITGEISVDPTTLPAGQINETRIVTVAAGGTSVGQIYRYDADTGWALLPVRDGQPMVPITTYGDFEGDHLFLWDADTSSWLDVGGTASGGGVRVHDRNIISFDTVGGSVNVNSTPIPINTMVKEIHVEILEAFNGSSFPSGGTIVVAGDIVAQLDENVDFQDVAASLTEPPNYVMLINKIVEVSGDIVFNIGTLAGDETVGSVRITAFYA